MDLETGAALIRAARSMLRMDVEEFSTALFVGAATVKRLEAGSAIRSGTLAKMIAGLPNVGITLTPPDPTRGVGYGIAFATPVETRRRRADRKTRGAQ